MTNQLLKFGLTLSLCPRLPHFEAGELNLMCEAWPELAPSFFGCFKESSSLPYPIDQTLTDSIALSLSCRDSTPSLAEANNYDFSQEQDDLDVEDLER